MSHMRLEKGWEIGQPGAVYEFEIKIQKITGVDMTDEQLEREAKMELRAFIRQLKRRYSWIGEVWQTGRLGGWLAVEDKKGRATKANIRTIIGLIEEAQDDFVQYLQERYPA